MLVYLARVNKALIAVALIRPEITFRKYGVCVVVWIVL